MEYKSQHKSKNLNQKSILCTDVNFLRIILRLSESKGGIMVREPPAPLLTVQSPVPLSNILQSGQVFIYGYLTWEWRLKGRYYSRIINS